MATAVQFAAKQNEKPEVCPMRPYFSIRDLAERWCCSRAAVYNWIRGEKVLDFAANGRKGHKLVPLETVLKIERSRMRVLR